MAEVKNASGYFVTQKRYVASLLYLFLMGERKVMTTPMEPCLNLTKDLGKKLQHATIFRKLVGTLIVTTKLKSIFEDLNPQN